MQTIIIVEQEGYSLPKELEFIPRTGECFSLFGTEYEVLKIRHVLKEEELQVTFVGKQLPSQSQYIEIYLGQ